jgi:CelD/BcsL family acetyltransferase involved in cellulose biosynthesis
MDPDWMRYGLGQVLIGNAIEQTVAAGHATFDFLRGDESYKSGWADRSRQNVTVRFFDRRAASLAARLGLQVSAGVRRAVRRSATLLSAALPEKLRAWPRPRSIRT